MRTRAFSTLCALMTLTASAAYAEPVELRGVAVDLGEGWSVVERVDAVSMESVTLKNGDSMVVVAAGPLSLDRALEEVPQFAQDRLDSRLPMLLEEHRKGRFKVGALKAKGLKGIGTDRNGEDWPVQCGTAVDETSVLSLCAAGPKKELKSVVKGFKTSVTPGAAGKVLNTDGDLVFEGISLPVPAGWQSFMVSGGNLPFAHLAQKQAGFIRVIKLPPAIAALPIPWELVAGWVADAGAGKGAGTESAGKGVSVKIGDLDAKLRTFKVRAAQREGRIAFVHPFGRRDLVLFGLARSPAFDAWFNEYLGAIELTEAFDPTMPEPPAGSNLLDTVRDLSPGAGKVLEGLLGGKKDKKADEDNNPCANPCANPCNP